MAAATSVELKATAPKRVVAHALVFIAGFTLVFVAAGASASAIGQLFAEYRDIITRVFGLVVIVLGLNMLGLFRVGFLAADKRLRFERKGVSYIGSLLTGIGFAAGWSPCIGPVLAGVLALASASNTVASGMLLLLVYSLGLGLLFFATAVALQYALPLLARLKRYLRAIEIAAGLIVIIMGLVLVTNKWLFFVGYLYKTFPALANVGTGPEASAGALSFGIVFIAGVVSFISPCVLPLVPVYISYLTGQSIESLVAAYESSRAARQPRPLRQAD